MLNAVIMEAGSAAPRHAVLASAYLDGALVEHLAESARVALKPYLAGGGKANLHAIISLLLALSSHLHGGQTVGQLVCGIRCCDSTGMPPRAGLLRASLLLLSVQWLHQRLLEQARSSEWVLSIGWRHAATVVLDAATTLSHAYGLLELGSILLGSGSGPSASSASSASAVAVAHGPAPSLLHRLFGIKAVVADDAGASTAAAGGPSHPAVPLVSVYALLEVCSDVARGVYAAAPWQALARRAAVLLRRALLAHLLRMRLLIIYIVKLVRSRMAGDTGELPAAAAASASRSSSSSSSSSGGSGQSTHDAAIPTGAPCTMCSQAATTPVRAACGHIFCYFCLHATVMSAQARAAAAAAAEAGAGDGTSLADDDAEPECPACYRPLAIR